MKDHPSQRIHSGLSCLDLTDRSSEYLDDRLPILTKVRVGLHLASCTHCRTYVKQIDLVSSALRNLPKLYLAGESSSPAPAVCRAPRLAGVSDICHARRLHY